MLRIFKNLFRAELVKPLVVQDFFIKNIKEEIKYNLGSKNKNKIFYIIRRKFSPSGLFSNLTFVINNLLYANKKNYIPFVDMQNFPTIYNEKRKKNIVTCKEILEKGSLVVFPSFVWHQVKPVTKGTRYSLVIWNLGSQFR